MGQDLIRIKRMIFTAITSAGTTITKRDLTMMARGNQAQEPSTKLLLTQVVVETTEKTTSSLIKFINLMVI